MSELRLLKEKREPISEANRHASLLMAKLQPPAIRRLHSRPRLLARLELPAALTVITAPAGCGKTALLSDWAALHPKSASWLTLDETDNHLPQFLAYVAAALDIDGEIPSAESLLVAIHHETPYAEQPHTLILDDFHTITSDEVLRAVAFLIDHCPSTLRLVMAGRSLPPLPLARLRVRGTLAQLRSPELAFSREEALAFLNASVSNEQEDLLNQMEGWAAGLQFIALASEESHNPSEQALLARHYIREFVAQEILPTFAPHVQDFLLHTSVLETLIPQFCDALMERAGSFAVLESLATKGCFVRRSAEQTYRYTPFFQAALREQLALTAPELMTHLLKRSETYTYTGDAAETALDAALSQREHEVLTMLADGLSSPEIARRMIIAVSTVKTHIKHIYRKLEVDNRHQAIKRARELNLIQIEMEERMRKMFR